MPDKIVNTRPALPPEFAPEADNLRSLPRGVPPEKGKVSKIFKIFLKKKAIIILVALCPHRFKKLRVTFKPVLKKLKSLVSSSQLLTENKNGGKL